MRCDGGRSKGLKEANAAAGERDGVTVGVLSCFGGLLHERQSVTTVRERERGRSARLLLASPDRTQLFAVASCRFRRPRPGMWVERDETKQRRGLYGNSDEAKRGKSAVRRFLVAFLRFVYCR
jgi:hypothetical protein